MGLRLRLLLFAVLLLVIPGRALSGPIATDYTLGPTSVLGDSVSGIYDLSESAGVVVATLAPPHLLDQLNPSTNYMSVLQSFFPVSSGWSFVNSASELTDGSLLFDTYDTNISLVDVGTQIHANYEPGVGDPTAATHDIHWIQVVTNNHNISTNSGHGRLENIVDAWDDNTDSMDSTPYYDIGGAADATDWMDDSKRPDLLKAHYWSGEVFLVSTPKNSGLVAQTVTLYSGATWGWTNVPEPTTALLLTLGLAGLGMRRRH